MAAQLRGYLIIAKKRVHCQPLYAHLSGVRAYTGSQCIRRTERVNGKESTKTNALVFEIQMIPRDALHEYGGGEDDKLTFPAPGCYPIVVNENVLHE
jgi:hypothetical protein